MVAIAEHRCEGIEPSTSPCTPGSRVGAHSVGDRGTAHRRDDMAMRDAAVAHGVGSYARSRLSASPRSGKVRGPARPLVLRQAWRGVRAVEGARLESVYTAYPRIEGSNPSLSAITFNGGLRRFPATIGGKPRQARKGATVVIDSGAGGRPAEVAARLRLRSATPCRCAFAVAAIGDSCPHNSPLAGRLRPARRRFDCGVEPRGVGQSLVRRNQTVRTPTTPTRRATAPGSSPP